MSWEKLPFDELFYRQGKDYLPLQVRLNARSKPMQLKGMALFEVYIKSVNDQGELAYRLVGQTRILPNTTQILYFVTKAGPQAELPLRFSSIDDSLESFPAGSFRFVNMSKQPLQVGFSNTVKRIDPRSMQIIKPEISGNGSFIPFIIADSKGNNVYETQLIGQVGGRKMVFIIPDERKGRPVKVRFLSQVVSASPESGDR